MVTVQHWGKEQKFTLLQWIMGGCPNPEQPGLVGDVTPHGREVESNYL